MPSQIVSGLALTIFAGAAGLSSYLGNDLELADAPAEAPASRELDVLGLGDLPVVGPILFDQSALVYALVGLVVLVGLYLARTRPGPQRAGGGRVAGVRPTRWESTSPRTATPTPRRRRLRGCRGRLLQPPITPQWVGDGLTGGAGWIAIALVIFAFWRADLCLVGAYLFGAFSALPFTLQARDVERHSGAPLRPSLRDDDRRARARLDRAREARLGAPAALGIPYVREER